MTSFPAVTLFDSGFTRSILLAMASGSILISKPILSIIRLRKVLLPQPLLPANTQNFGLCVCIMIHLLFQVDDFNHLEIPSLVYLLFHIQYMCYLLWHQFSPDRQSF